MKILTFEGLARLEENLKEGIHIQEYAMDGYPFEEGDIKEIGGPDLSLPDLTTPGLFSRKTAELDTENAILLHQTLALPHKIIATDPRFWTYLCHGTHYSSYMKARHEPVSDSQNLKYSDYHKFNRNIQKKINSHILRWYFTGSSNRSLRRNALAGLWWAAEFTYAPWEKDEFLAPTKHKDPYHYTRILYRNTDVYQQVMERTYSFSPRIRTTVLDTLDERGLIKRQEYRDYLKTLSTQTLIQSFNFYDSYKDLRKALERLVSL